MKRMEKREGWREKGRVECIELERQRDTRRGERVSTPSGVREVGGREKEGERDQSWNCLFLAALTPSCTCKMDGYGGQKVWCCSVFGCVCVRACVYVCVLGSSSCVISGSVMEETLHVNICGLCSLQGLYCCYVTRYWLSSYAALIDEYFLTTCRVHVRCFVFQRRVIVHCYCACVQFFFCEDSFFFFLHIFVMMFTFL